MNFEVPDLKMRKYEQSIDQRILLELPLGSAYAEFLAKLLEDSAAG